MNINRYNFLTGLTSFTGYYYPQMDADFGRPIATMAAAGQNKKGILAVHHKVTNEETDD
jgi:hypothetical protein